MDSLKGQLLISAGGLYDPNFRHTVVLIGEHDERGAVGIVLNRALEAEMEEDSWIGAGGGSPQGRPRPPPLPAAIESIHMY